MKIQQAVKLEDCFEGSKIFRYNFDDTWTRDAIQGLAEFGRLEYFPNYPRPFFRVIGHAGQQIKGVEGDATCLAVFPRNSPELVRQEFENRFGK